MEIAARTLKKELSDRGENGIPQIPVQGRHSSGKNASAKPIADDQVVAETKLFNKSRNIVEIVTGIRISHDDVPASGSGDSSHEGTSVSLCLDVDDNRSQASGDTG